MKTSESLAHIAPALLKAQKAIGFAVKDANNPFFKSKYADLPTVIDAVKSHLNDNGIVFLQTATDSDINTLSLVTRLLHESGEWIEDTATATLAKNDPQGYGSAITYLRRYSLSAITGLYQDDDDGNAASNVGNHKVETTKKNDVVYLTIERANQLIEAAAIKGISAEDICKIAKVESITQIESGRFNGVLTWIGKQPIKSQEQ